MFPWITPITAPPSSRTSATITTTLSAADVQRRVLLCTHFARNMAYYRAGHHRLTKASPKILDQGIIVTSLIPVAGGAG